MKRFYAIALTGAILSGLGMIQPGVSAAATTCPAVSPAANSIVVGNLTVTGGTCTLTNVTVTGNVTVLPTGSLAMSGGSVGGSVTVAGGRINTQAVAIKGSLNVTGTPDGQVGNTICGGSIGGSVNVTGVDGTDATDNGGYFELGGLIPGRCALAPITIGGSVRFTNNRGYVRLRNGVVKGSVEASGNKSGFYGAPFGSGDILDNTITGSLKCSANTNGIDGGNNTAATTQCTFI